MQKKPGKLAEMGPKWSQRRSFSHSSGPGHLPVRALGSLEERGEPGGGRQPLQVGGRERGGGQAGVHDAFQARTSLSHMGRGSGRMAPRAFPPLESSWEAFLAWISAWLPGVWLGFMAETAENP